MGSLGDLKVICQIGEGVSPKWGYGRAWLLT